MHDTAWAGLLKGIGYLVAVAIIASIVYATTMTIRYWSGISV
jgi:hypothetical protein